MKRTEIIRSLRYLAFIFIGIIFLAACRKKDDVSVDIGWDYLPYEVGAWVEYDVLEIAHDVSSDTLAYQLREVNESIFIDGEGNEAMRIERYWRTSDTLPWQIKDVWVTNRDYERVEKVEENERYIKMVFPVRTGQIWDGNAYNTQLSWEYYYDSIHEPYLINGITVDSSVKVVQRENLNAIEYENAFEIYGKGIGLIKRQLIDLDINNFDPTDIRKGKELYMEMTSYGN